MIMHCVLLKLHVMTIHIVHVLADSAVTVLLFHAKANQSIFTVQHTTILFVFSPVLVLSCKYSQI